MAVDIHGKGACQKAEMFVSTHILSPRKQKLVMPLCPLIPLFHTGHESPESPRIVFFLIRGDSSGFIIFFSNRVVVRVIPDSDTMSLRIFGGIGSIRLESRKNSLRLAK